MGRLKQFKKLSKRAITFRNIRITGIVLAVIASLILYLNISRVTGPSADRIKDYLKTNQLTISTDTVNDFQQVYFVFDGKKIFITEGNTNRTVVKSNGQYVVWLETPYQSNASLLFLYDVISKSKTQLTYFGTVSRPSIDGNKVVWEDLNGSHSRIFYYDGTKTTQISDNYPSYRPAIKANQILFAQEIAPSSWQVILENTDTKDSKVVATGDNTNAWPRFEGDKITTNNPID